jgi:hypothetical protein
MGKPKSLKDLIPNIKLQPPQIILPVNTSPKPTPAQLKAEKDQQKAMWQYVNAQRCPICQSQLEGGIFAKEARVYCVRLTSEYECVYVFGQPLPFRFVMRFDYHPNRYEIVASNFLNGVYEQTVYLIDLDLFPKYQQQNKKRIAQFNAPMLTPSWLNEKELTRKISLYNLFD